MHQASDLRYKGLMHGGLLYRDRQRWKRELGGKLAGLAAFALLMGTAAADDPIQRTPSEVLLVYNSLSPISCAIARDYEAQRHVENVVAVQCADAAVDADNETLSFGDYQSLIEAKVRAYLASHHGIDFIVTTKGVPLRIEGAETGCRDEDSAPGTPLRTSLDSQLAALDYPDIPSARKLSITGSGATGTGWLNRYYLADEPFSHAKYGGYLVTRLDGYTETEAKALVSRALQAERGLTYGKVLLDAQSLYGLGNKNAPPEAIPDDNTIKRESAWSTYNAEMQSAHDLLDKRGIPNEINLTPAFIGHRQDLLGYFSWGSNDRHFSDEAYQTLIFAPGSIGDTAVSSSGRTFLPTSGGQSLLVDLIAHGLTCGKGYTDEPLLQATATPAVLLERYTSGYTMAESFYMASRFVGWQDVVIGDPLCCPFHGGYVGKIPRAPAAK